MVTSVALTANVASVIVDVGSVVNHVVVPSIMFYGGLTGGEVELYVDDDVTPCGVIPVPAGDLLWIYPKFIFGTDQTLSAKTIDTGVVVTTTTVEK